jgi:hypothetical protein
MNKKIGAALCLTAACVIGVAAQSSTSKTTVKTEVEVKGGKSITTVGCLENNPDGGFMLHSLGNGGVTYALVTDDNLSKYLHHTVRVTGKAADGRKGKVEVKTKTDVDHKQVGGPAGETKTQLGAEDGLSYLGLKSVKNVSKSCN